MDLYKSYERDGATIRANYSYSTHCEASSGVCIGVLNSVSYEGEKTIYFCNDEDRKIFQYAKHNQPISIEGIGAKVFVNQIVHQMTEAVLYFTLDEYPNKQWTPTGDLIPKIIDGGYI